MENAMRFILPRDSLLKPLQMISGVVERRQTMPILANVLISAEDNKLRLTGTDLEVELSGEMTLDQQKTKIESLTLPARKLLDICKVLPEGAEISFYREDNDKMLIRSGRSRYVLASLPASDYPSIDWQNERTLVKFKIPQNKLLVLLESTQFAMAQQDVRYYLNGLLLEIKSGIAWAVGTDGHRLALNGVNVENCNDALVRVILPRKGVLELIRLLDNNANELQVFVSENHVRIVGEGFVFTSKLIDGKYPDYDKAIPKGGDKRVTVERQLFKEALNRVAILSNDALRGVQLNVRSGALLLRTLTTESEEAEDEIAVEYEGDEFTTGFNVTYLLDILNYLDTKKVTMRFKSASGSVLLEHPDAADKNLYVVMPLRI